eukprot:417745_1
MDQNDSHAASEQDLPFIPFQKLNISVTNQPIYCNGKIFILADDDDDDSISSRLFQFNSDEKHHINTTELRFLKMSGQNTIIGISADSKNKSIYIFGSNGKIRKLNTQTNKWSHYPAKLKFDSDMQVTDFYGFYLESENLFLFLVNGSPFVYNFNTKKTVEYATNWPCPNQVLYCVSLKRLIGIINEHIYYADTTEITVKKRLSWNMYHCKNMDIYPIFQSKTIVGILYGYCYLLLFNDQSHIHCVDLSSGLDGRSFQTFYSLQKFILKTESQPSYWYYRKPKKAKLSFGVATDYGTIHLFSNTGNHGKIHVDLSEKLLNGYVRDLEQLSRKLIPMDIKRLVHRYIVVGGLDLFFMQ